MVRVIGAIGCSRCEMIKNILTSKSVKFEYVLLDDLDNKDELIKKAQDKGQLTMPLLVRNGEIITIAEV